MLQWSITSHWSERPSLKKPTNGQYWRGCEEKETLLSCWWECTLMYLWRTVWRFLKKGKPEKKNFSVTSATVKEDNHSFSHSYNSNMNRQTDRHTLELIHWVEVLWSSPYGNIRIKGKDNSFIYSALTAHWLHSKYYVKHVIYKDKWDMNSDFQKFTVDLGREISKLMITMKYGKCCDGKKPRLCRNMGEMCPAKPEESGAGLLDIETLSSCLEDRY